MSRPDPDYVVSWTCDHCGRRGEVRFSPPVPGPAERYQRCIEDHDIPTCTHLPYVSARSEERG